MRDILTIVKKELRSIFTNKHTIMQVLIIPMVLILLGSIMMFTVAQNSLDEQNNVSIKGYVVNTPECFEGAFSEIGLQSISENNIDEIKPLIEQTKIDILLVFPSDFTITTNSENLSNIEMWYNSSNTNSVYGQQLIMGILDSIRPNVYTINVNNPESYDLVQKDDILVVSLEMFWPIYAIMGVFCASMAIAAEIIVGDKERGFMNLLLIAPVKRTHIAMGKVLTLFIVNIVSSLSVLVGTFVSIIIYQNMNLGGPVRYTAATYLGLFTCVLFGSFAMTSLCFLISTNAKTVRQSNSTCSLILTVTTIVNFATILPSVNQFIFNLGYKVYLIPIFNTNICMQEIIRSEARLINIIMAIVTNTVLAILITIYVAKMFDNEKIMQD